RNEVDLLQADAVLAGDRAADLRADPHDRATCRHHACLLARLARIVEDVRVEVAVAGVEDVPDAQAVSGDDLVDAAEHVRELRARDHTVHHHVRGRHATVGAERGLALLWKGRKSAFGAYGRVSPAYMVMDGVIPRTKLPYVLGRVNEIVAAHGLRVGNVFHAGDGNLHPNILYDPRKPGEE